MIDEPATQQYVLHVHSLYLTFIYMWPQLWRSSPKPTGNGLMEMESGGFPWWLNWLDRRVPNQAQEQATMDPAYTSTPHKSTQANCSPLTNVGNITPSASTWSLSPITRPSHSYNTNGASTPHKSMQAKFAMSPLTKAKRSPISGARTPQNNPSKKNAKPSKSREGEFSFDVPLKDDDSLTSCPSFSVPSYMAPTVSAKAKVRAQSNPKERLMGSPSGGPKKRLSFHLPQSIGSLRWTKGSLFSGKESSGQWLVSGSNKPVHAIGNLSVDSSLSLPAGVGMKSFKWFVWFYVECFSWNAIRCFDVCDYNNNGQQRCEELMSFPLLFFIFFIF